MRRSPVPAVQPRPGNRIITVREIGKMNELKPRAVIFDMDGLIVDSEILYRMAWRQSAAELGHHMSDDLYACLTGRRTVECETLLLETYGSKFPLNDFLARSDQLCEELVEKYGVSTKPGLNALLDLLDAWHLPKAVATSTDRVNALRCLGDLVDRFVLIVTGDEVTAGKPDPEIFLLTAAHLQFAPQQCLVLEDANAGVQAAHAAGMSVIMVPDLTPPSPRSLAIADRVCLSLHEVKDFIEITWNYHAPLDREKSSS
jgi:HAD superfamily hydrolase (TIGR01509 family)